MSLIFRESKVWDPGLFDDPPKEWVVNSVGALLHYGAIGNSDLTLALIYRPVERVWGLPAGHVEPNDKSIEEAISREVREELGLIIPAEDFEFQFKVDHPTDPNKTRVILMAQIGDGHLNRIGTTKYIFKDGIFAEVFLVEPTPEVSRLILINASALLSNDFPEVILFKSEILRYIRWAFG